LPLPLNQQLKEFRISIKWTRRDYRKRSHGISHSDHFHHKPWVNLELLTHPCRCKSTWFFYRSETCGYRRGSLSSVYGNLMRSRWSERRIQCLTGRHRPVSKLHIPRPYNSLRSSASLGHWTRLLPLRSEARTSLFLSSLDLWVMYTMLLE
jgi:hypothetical protein